MSETAASWRWSEIVVELLLQIGLVAALSALSYWIWPERMLEADRAVSVSDWFLAALSVWVGFLALVSFYFLAVEPLIGLIRHGGKTVADADEIHIDEAKNP